MPGKAAPKRKKDDNTNEEVSEVISDTESEMEDSVESASHSKTKKRKEHPTTLDLMKFLKTMDSKYDNTNQKVESVLNSVKSLEERISKVEETVQTSHKQYLNGYSKEFEQIQIDLRKLNLIFVGITEVPNETESDLLNYISEFCKDELNHNGVQLDTAHRLGNNRFGPRSIKVKFLSLRQRNEIFTSRDTLRTKKIPVYINEDLPPFTANRRKILRVECNKAIKSGNKTRLLGDKLWISDTLYELNDKNELVRAKINNKTYQPKNISASTATINPGASGTRRHAEIHNPRTGTDVITISQSVTVPVITVDTASTTNPFQPRPLINRSPSWKCGNCGNCAGCLKSFPHK